MIERGPQASVLDQLCGELEVQPVARFHGGEKLALEGEPATMYLVEGEHKTYYNLKVGNFNSHEVEQTNQLRELTEGSKLIRVPKIISSESDRYILFEHLRGLPISRESFWKQPHLIDKSLKVLGSIDHLLNSWPLSEQEIKTGREWVAAKLSKDWVEPILQDAELTRGGLINPEFIGQIQAYAKTHQPELDDMVRIWRDPNGDHLIFPYDGLEQRVGVVDIDFSARPRHYMPMRFLAWSLLKLDDERTNLESWANEVRQKQNLGPEMNATFVLSLTGILYDLASGERDNKNKREIAITVKDMISSIIKHDQAPAKQN